MIADAGIAVDTQVLRGRAAEQIVYCAEARGADVIVMSTHGWTGLARLVHGSVAEAVHRASPVPVLQWRARFKESQSGD